MKYACKACGKIVERDSTAAYIVSWCEETNKNVRLKPVKDEKDGKTRL